MKQIAVLPGDGIGPEVTEQAERVLKALRLPVQFTHADVGGIAYERHGQPLPPATLALAKGADAILFGAVGDFKYDTLERALRPEQAILGLRRELALFANLRPALCYEALAEASSLKRDLVSGLDILIVRELTGDVYFGQPRGRRKVASGEFAGQDEGFDTMRYSVPEIERIAHIAFTAAAQRRQFVTSVDKANVLETSQLWRESVSRVHGAHYPVIRLEHMYVDNAAMQLTRAPRHFDVILTGNLFGDILSDQAAALTGSLGMLPSASLNASEQGLFEPCHGSAPDIAGRGVANPLAAILSAAMLLRHSLKLEAAARRIESAVQSVLAQGLRTADIAHDGEPRIGCAQMGDAVLAALAAQTH